MLAALFVCGSIGTGLELLLLGHVEAVWQKVPLVLLGIGCMALGMMAAAPSGPVRHLFHVAMWLCVASGVVGMWLHYQGNAAFEQELNPELSGWELFRESLAGATPSLAPGTMALLGAIGLAYAYCHPSRLRRD